MFAVIELGFGAMLTAYVFLVLALILSRIMDINKEQELLLACVRMTLQLMIAGYLLTYIFDANSPYMTLAVFVLMEGVAVQTAIRKSGNRLTLKLKMLVAISIVLGTSLSLVYFLFVVVRLAPWYDSRYVISLAGMLIGNSMTGISLGINGLVKTINKERRLIEGALMLGATPQQATKSIVQDAFSGALIPTLNSMFGMGLVFLPGMMTGQILAGISPITAIAYQIAIVLGILGAVTLSVFIFLQFGYRTFFTNRSQLIC